MNAAAEFLGAWLQAVVDVPNAHRALIGAVGSVSDALSATGSNDQAHTYTIFGFDGSPYITRTLLPRISGKRPLIHRIHREDRDPHPHNHPWAEADFIVVSGGYVNERWSRDGQRSEELMRPGSVNHLEATCLHRVREVRPGTVTVGLVGERVQDWGFLVDGAIVPHGEYFASRNHRIVTGGLS